MAEIVENNAVENEAVSTESAVEEKNDGVVTLEDIVKASNVKGNVYECEWNGLKFNVYKVITLGAATHFVDSVVSAVFSGENDRFMPEVKDFATNLAIVAHYTDIVLPEITNEEMIEAINYVFEMTDLIRVIKSHIDSDQFFSIDSAIFDRIEHRNNVREALLERRFNDAAAAVEKVGEDLSSAMSGIEPGDLAKVIGAVSNGGLDEKKLVEAFASEFNLPHTF